MGAAGRASPGTLPHPHTHTHTLRPTHLVQGGRVAAPAAVEAAAEDRMVMDTSAFPPVNIDAADAGNPVWFSEYVKSIYSHFKAEEVTKSAHHGYMAHQTDINEKMRAILLDWLVEVHLKFKLMPETMFLTANIIDRFLERKLVIRQKLQLVGVTAMLLASKYEEIYAPEVRDFVYITDKAYTREQILAMESAILNTLEFRITVPTAYVFLNRFLKAAGADERTSLLATYLVERTMQEYKLLSHLPSKVAAAGVNMALRTLRGRDAWTSTMEHYTGFSQEELRGAIVDLQDVLAAGVASSLQAVRKKYQTAKFGEVANMPIAPLE